MQTQTHINQERAGMSTLLIVTSFHLTSELHFLSSQRNFKQSKDDNLGEGKGRKLMEHNIDLVIITYLT